jgi:uncharacterized repeat protein (TIGR01451 family)
VIDAPGSYTLDASDNTTEGVTHATSAGFHTLAHADIALTMSASPDGTAGDPAIAGTDETYTLTVTNDGPDMNSSYSVTASVPSGTQVVSAPGCSGMATITCTGGPLNNGSQHAFTIKLHIGSGYAGSDNSESLSFSASVDLTNPIQDPDNVVANDTAAQTFDVIGEADLSNTLTAPAGDQIAGAGAGFNYTLKVKNDGPSDNFGYQSVFSLPGQVSFDSFSGGSGGTCGAAAQVITCSNSGLTSGSTDTYTVHAKIAPSKPAANDNSTATVSTTSTPDNGSGSNDSAPTTLHTVTRANLSITKTAVAQLGTSHDLAYANNNGSQNRVTFTVTVKNADTSAAGPSDAQAVTVTDTVPTGTSFVATGSSTQCTLSAGVVTCAEAGALAPGASRTYTIIVQVSSTLRGGETNNFTNTARVSSTTADIGGASYPKTATSGTIRVHTVPDAPTNADARPGNGNAFYLWRQSLSSNGGETINNFTVTTSPSSPTSPITVGTTDACGTNNSSLFCTNIAQLTNTQLYTLSVTANNAVGSSNPLTATVTPTIDASAQQIIAGHLSQHTGNSTLPSKNDQQISFQDFPSNTTGVGTVLETNQGAALFCGGGACVGKIVQTKLEDPNLPGIYQITLLYDKTLVGGTGQKYTFFYAPNTTSATGNALATCPKTVTQTTTLPCVTVKLGSGGANPALKAIIYTRDVDPTIGGRAYPK